MILDDLSWSSGVQLYFKEEQLLFSGEQLKSRVMQLEIGSGQHNLQDYQLIFGVIS